MLNPGHRVRIWILRNVPVTGRCEYDVCIMSMLLAVRRTSYKVVRILQYFDFHMDVFPQCLEPQKR